MAEETAVEFDLLYYVREVGAEVRARLFPAPKEDGRQPYPNPVKVRYQPSEDVDMELRFVMERTFQPVGEFMATEVEPSLAFVLYGGRDAFLVDLDFDKQPIIPQLEGVGEKEAEMLLLLLKAVAGNL